MSSSGYPEALRQRLNSMYIPDITDPYHLKIHWIRSVIPEEASVYISKDSHIHTFFELHIMAEGFFEYTFSNGKKVLLSKGNALLIPSKESHTISSFIDTANKITISFSPDKDSPLYNELKKVGVRDYPVNEKINSVIKDIMAECRINTTVSPYVIRNKIFEILVASARILSMPGVIPRSDAVIEDRRVTSAKLYIRNNNNRLLTLKEVSDYCGVSTKQMDRIFLACQGCHLFEYIKHARLAEAERLLLETKVPIKEISEKLGFSNVYNFTNFFTKNAGITPAAFRKTDMRKENKNVNIPYTL